MTFNKFPQFLSPVQDFLAWTVDALSIPWRDLDSYAFPPVAILTKVVVKLMDYPCRRIILIALTQNALVLGPGSHVNPGPSVHGQSANSAIQSDSTQES